MWRSQSSIVVVPLRLTRLNRVSRAPRKRETDKPGLGRVGFGTGTGKGWVGFIGVVADITRRAANAELRPMEKIEDEGRLMELP